MVSVDYLICYYITITINRQVGLKYLSCEIFVPVIVMLYINVLLFLGTNKY